MACGKGPSEFCADGDASVVSTSWTSWLEEFEAYADSKGVFDLDGDRNKDMRAQRKALLLYHAGARVREIHKTLTATNRHAYDDFVAGLNAYFTVEPNETFQRHIFRKMVQLEQETVSQYCSRLRKAASNGCNYHNVDKMIRDQIVEYCLSDDLRKKLMEEGNGLDLNKTLQLAATQESVDIHMNEMSNRPVLNRVRVSSGTGNNNQRTPSSRTSTCYSDGCNRACESCGRGYDAGKFEQCERCGRSKSHERCPAAGKQCHLCQGYNHFRKMCKTKKVNCVAADSVDQSEVDGKSPDSYYAFTIHTVSKLDSLERANLHVGGVSLRAIIDTGADCNVISMQEWQKLKQAEVKIIKSERCDNFVYSYASKAPLKVIGQFWADVDLGSGDSNGGKGDSICVQFKVIEGDSEPVLGLAACKAMNIVHINLNRSCIGSQYIGSQNAVDTECVDLDARASVSRSTTSNDECRLPMLRWTAVALMCAVLIVGGFGLLACFKGGYNESGMRYCQFSRTLFEIGESMRSPVGISESMRSPVEISESMSSPVEVSEAMNSPVEVRDLVNSLFGISESMHLPVVINESSKNSPVKICESMRSLNGVCGSFDLPDTWCAISGSKYFELASEVKILNRTQSNLISEKGPMQLVRVLHCCCNLDICCLHLDKCVCTHGWVVERVACRSGCGPGLVSVSAMTSIRYLRMTNIICCHDVSANASLLHEWITSGQHQCFAVK